MVRLQYAAICSLDGYTEDADGKFDWAAPDEEVHAFINDLARPLGICLYGRRMYETMAYWETADDRHAVMRDFAEIWRSAEKIVYSRTLDAVSTARTRLERHFKPDAVRRMKAESERDIGIGGAELAAQAIRAGLVDEYHLFLNPVTVGTGKPALPGALPLELLDERRFASGVVHLHYRAPAA